MYTEASTYIEETSYSLIHNVSYMNDYSKQPNNEVDETADERCLLRCTSIIL
jgi:hypothetical protein